MVSLNSSISENIINLIKENSNINIEEIAFKIKVAQITIKRNLKKLQSQGIISRSGGDKNGSWVITEKTK